MPDNDVRRMTIEHCLKDNGIPVMQNRAAVGDHGFDSPGAPRGPWSQAPAAEPLPILCGTVLSVSTKRAISTAVPLSVPNRLLHGFTLG